MSRDLSNDSKDSLEKEMGKIEKTTYLEFDAIKLTNGIGNSAIIVPERGGILAQLTINGVQILDMKEDTFIDKSVNVRGGNPILFPICGPLEDGKYVLANGEAYNMKQHGFARRYPWRQSESITTPQSIRTTLELESNEETKKEYPFDFKLSFTYVLKKDKLEINQVYKNNSTEDMPFYAGFHPYFYLPDGKVKALNIPAAQYRDMGDMKLKENSQGINLNGNEEKTYLFGNLTSNTASFTRADRQVINVEYDENFKYIMAWRNGRYFCVEPWMDEPMAMNNRNVMTIEPGEELTCTVGFSVGEKQKESI